MPRGWPNLDVLAVRALKAKSVVPARRAAQAWLGRPFGDGGGKRILLLYHPHRLAWGQFYPFLYFGQRMARAGYRFRAAEERDFSVGHRLLKEADVVFLQSDYPALGAPLRARLADIRAVRPDIPLAFFDWAAPVDARFAADVEPFVTAYVRKALARDRADYVRLPKSHTHLEDYYIDRFRTAGNDLTWGIEPAIVDRLVVGPAFSTSIELLPGFDRAAAPPDRPRPIDLHARIATKGTPWYQAMREDARDAVRRLPADWRIVSEGFVPPQKFMEELSDSKLCFSPFGYGEICWRDFEAILAGAVVIKQDMSHIETDPDIYRPGETYLPVRWDLSDLEEVIAGALADPARCRRIAENAYRVVKDHLDGTALQDLLARLT